MSDETDDYVTDDDDELFKPGSTVGGLTERAKARIERMRPRFLCRLCVHTKDESGNKICQECSKYLNRLKGAHAEAAALIPEVRKLGLTEFFLKLWEYEKQKRGFTPRDGR